MSRLALHFYLFLARNSGRSESLCLALFLLALVSAPAAAQDSAASAPMTQPQASPAAKAPTVVAPSMGGQAIPTGATTTTVKLYHWKELTAAQRQALAPLEKDWASIDQQRRRKWLEIAARFQSLPTDEQARMQERMSSWATLSPVERSQTRMLFQQAQQIAPQSRQEKWEAYQALAPEQRQELADKAAKRKVAGNAPREDAAKASGRTLPDKAKSNLVPDRSQAPQPSPVTPTLVRNKPGATTTLINQTVTAPVHQQSGLPKIMAVPDLVNPKTLLPKRATATDSDSTEKVTSRQ